MGLLDRLAIAALPLVPRPIMRALASRYIAGEELGDALACLESLGARGFPGIIDILGEDVADEAAARRVVAAYVQASEAVARARLDAYVSVKPTHIGLRLSEELAFELYAELARAAVGHGNFVRVEMEDHTTTDATLRVFHRLRASFENVGIVLQSRLFRTPADIEALPRVPVSVRMVKGIYLEPPSIAHVAAEPIRDEYVRCARMLLERGDSVGFATHDEVLADRLFAVCRELDVPRERFELQVLLGVREPLWHAWREAGHTVRVYVPYGREWRAYSTRRLSKNPQIFRHVVGDFLRRR